MAFDWQDRFGLEIKPSHCLITHENEIGLCKFVRKDKKKKKEEGIVSSLYAFYMEIIAIK